MPAFGAQFNPRVGVGPQVDPRVPAQVPAMQPTVPYPWPGPQTFGPAGADIGAYREIYRELALMYAGVTLPKNYVLVPYRYNKQLQIFTRADGTIVALDAATPSQPLDFQFPVFAFVQRLTATVRGVVFNEAGQPSAGFFGDVDPLSYIQCTMGYAQQSEQFLSGPVPLSEVAGSSASLGGAYLFSALPWVPKGTVLNTTYSILEPGFPGGTPPFVRSVAALSLTFDTLRIPILGG